MIKDIINALALKIVRLEHIVYCYTFIELPLHKLYYRESREYYEDYQRRHHPEWYTDNIL